MEGPLQHETPKFTSPEEELRYLRELVAQKERVVWQEQDPTPKEQIISQTVHEYATSDRRETHEEQFILEDPLFEEVVTHLGKLEHREKVRELYRILEEKGILNAIAIARELNDPHIEDDFHRVLVGYVHTGGNISGLDKERTLDRSLHMKLFEVTLPHSEGGQKSVPFMDVIIEMERFLRGMLSPEGAIASENGYIVCELAIANFSSDIVFYISVPETESDLFSRQVLGAFPQAKIDEQVGDYNIFNEFGVAVGSYAEVSNNFAYPIKFPEENGSDPLKMILNAFSKVDRDGEGASIQFVLYPDMEKFDRKFKHAITKIHEGVPVKSAIDIPLGLGGEFRKAFGELFASAPKKGTEAGKEDRKKDDFGEKARALIEEKLEYTQIRANIRIIASAATTKDAEDILGSIEASFQQFGRPSGNGVKFVRATKSRLEKLTYNYTFRNKDESETIIFNTKEVATMFHFAGAIERHEAPQLKAVKAQSAPAPSDLPHEGVLLGINNHRGESREIRMERAMRLRHLYVIGQTGTGKSKLLQNLINQDIANGDGVCFIDPHGSDVMDILSNIPKERIDDVIYFDPSYMERPFGLNMLEYDIRHPEQKIFVVNEMLSIFHKLYEAIPESMGPAFEQYFRNATMLVMEDPETGNTMLEIPRVMADPQFRALKLSRCKNPIVLQFWRDIAAKTSGENSLQNMIPWITNKFDVFLANDIMRPIIAQEKSSFNFREIMDNKKILLVNLAKGKLGEINANLIGLVLVGKILMAAMSRVDSYGKQLPDFYLYIDEFQNISTNSISAILSEARKYGLSLNVAHQYIAQLQDDIRDAVFGNVGSMAVFRVGTEDAEALESQFAPVFSATDITKIENQNCYMRMLINGKPVPPFNLKIPIVKKGNSEIVEQIAQLSYLKYGRDRALVDEAVIKRYQSSSVVAQQTAQQATQQGAVRPAEPSLPTSVSTAPRTGGGDTFVSAPSNPFAGAFAKAGVTATPPPVVSPSLGAIPTNVPPQSGGTMGQ